jgi:mRNA-degrading endonuclease RelE of RelBE toxin-antitoxin system
MAYEVVVPDKVSKEVKKRLKDKALINRFYKKLTKLLDNPTLHGKPLRSPLAGIWEIYFERRWRILFEIHEKEKVVLILAFKHKDEMKKL